MFLTGQEIIPLVAPSCKLELVRFSAKLRIQDGVRVCGNKDKENKKDKNVKFRIIK